LYSSTYCLPYLLLYLIIYPRLTRACLGVELVVCEYAEIDNHKIDPIGF
jgi:hypothetical protein